MLDRRHPRSSKKDAARSGRIRLSTATAGWFFSDADLSRWNEARRGAGLSPILEGQRTCLRCHAAFRSYGQRICPPCTAHNRKENEVHNV